MKRIALLILLIPSTIAMASQVTIPTIYQTNGTVTAANLNGNFTALAQTINGGLDNTNANTTQGYRFYQTVAVLPSPGNMGAVYFLTSDDTLNFDTGASFIKSVGVNVVPVQGDVIYYGASGWTDLGAGTIGQVLTTGGSSANPFWSFASNFSFPSQAQGDTLYFNGSVWANLPAGQTGQFLTTQGTNANPVWASAPSVILNYGTSTSVSTLVQPTAFKKAYGTTTSLTAGATFAITNLPFTSSSSYGCWTGIKDTNSSNGGNIDIVPSSGSAATITNQENVTHVIMWGCGGT